MPTHKILDERGQSFVFEGGDVIIRTSEHPSGIFVVHKDVLASKSSYLSACLSDKRNATRAETTVGLNEGNASHVLSLFFDQETSMSLLTAKPEGLDRSPFNRPDPYLLDPGYWEDRGVPATMCGKMASVIQSQFLWNEPQSQWYCDHVSYQSRSTGPMETYRRYELYYRVDIPEIGSTGSAKPKALCWWRDPSHNSSPSHHDAVRYAQEIWKGLILLLYGKPITLFSRCDWRRKIGYIANLLLYCEYLGMETVAPLQLGNALMSIPYLYQHVYEEPQTFFHLAHRLSLPSIYIEAAKHLLRPDCASIFHGICGNSFHAPHHSDRDADSKYYNMDMLALLMAAKTSLNNELGAARRYFTSLYADPFCTHNSWVLPRAPGTGMEVFSDKEWDTYKDAITLMFRDVFRAFALENHDGQTVHPYLCPNGARWDTENPSGNIITFDRMVTTLDKRLVEHTLNINEQAEKLALDPEKLMQGVMYLLRGHDFWEAGRLLPIKDHTCNQDHVPADDEQSSCWSYPRQLCRRCPFSKHPVDSYFAWLDPDSLFPGRDDRPWPLDEDIEDNYKTRTSDSVVTSPASHAYLESIGLGRAFEYLKGDTVKANWNTLPTADYSEERVAGVCEMMEFAERHVDAPKDATGRLLPNWSTDEPSLAYYEVPLAVFVRNSK